MRTDSGLDLAEPVTVCRPGGTISGRHVRAGAVGEHVWSTTMSAGDEVRQRSTARMTLGADSLVEKARAIMAPLTLVARPDSAATTSVDGNRTRRGQVCGQPDLVVVGATGAANASGPVNRC